VPTQGRELRNIKKLPRHTVRSRRIENDLAFIAHHFRNETGEISNRNFLAAADIEKADILEIRGRVRRATSVDLPLVAANYGQHFGQVRCARVDERSRPAF